MKIGYARVSTADQNLDLQLSALRRAGCAQIFEDCGISGARRARPGLSAALAALGADDTLVVWKLDRLGRSLPHLVETVNALAARGVQFHSLTEKIDTRSAGGRLIFHMMAALAEFERSIISERTIAGMAAAKRAGRNVGRRPVLTGAQIAEARALKSRGMSHREVCRRLAVSPSTLYRHLAL